MRLEPSPKLRRGLLAASILVYLVLLLYFVVAPHPTRLDLAVDALIRPSPATDVWGDEPDELLVDYTLIALLDAALILAAWRYGSPDTGLLLLAALGLQEMVIRGTKAWVDRPRPDDAYSVTGAYPSGHVANLTLSILLFLFIVLPLLRGRGAWRGRLPGESGYAGALIVTFALHRVFAGEHWITDVIGGIALALAFALAAEHVHRAVRTEKP